MPDALTARIEAALAAEAAARAADAPRAVDAPPLAAAAAGAALPHRARPGVAARGARPGRTAPGSRPGAGRAGAATTGPGWRCASPRSPPRWRSIAGGGYGVAQLLTGSPAVNGTASSAAPGAARGPEHPGHGPGAAHVRRRFQFGATLGRRQRSLPSRALVVSSGTNYQPAPGRPSQLCPRESEPPCPLKRPPGPTLAPSQSQASLFPDLQACLVHVGNGQHPLLVDVAKYQGHPALVVVLPSANGGRPEARVIAPGCTATTAQVLATATLPRSG